VKYEPASSIALSNLLVVIWNEQLSNVSNSDVLRGMRQVDDTVPDEAFLSFIEAGMRKSAEGFRFALDPETYRSWQPADMCEAVEKIPCPMLILRAEHSVVMSRSAAELMAQKAPGARLKEIGGAGHFLMLGKPAEVASEIRGFLEGVCERSGCSITSSSSVRISMRCLFGAHVLRLSSNIVSPPAHSVSASRCAFLRSYSEKISFHMSRSASQSSRAP
jgi:hypothetical protein